MINILAITSYFYPHKGGSQKYLEELYANLLKQYPNTYHIDILCYQTTDASSFETYRGLTIYRVPCWQLIPDRFALPNPFKLIPLLRRLAANKYDYVHSQLIFFDHCWWAWIYASLIGARSIFTEHCASYPVHQNKFVQFISKSVVNTIGKWSVNHYNICSTTNRAAADFLKNEVGINRNFTLIYGGVDTSYFVPQKHSKSRLTITYLGRLIWTKGITYLYDAIKQSQTQLPSNTKIIFAGGGELETKLRKQIRDDKLDKLITITGFIPYSKVRTILQKTDIFISPSHHNEGFPNTILEAGACGNFVIATDNAGTKELIKHKKNRSSY